MGKTILYIEDNPDNRMLVRRVLQIEGYEVIEANTGQEGVAKASEVKPDLILMDINLPDISGFEVTRTIRQLPEVGQTPILAMTANVLQGTLEKTLEAGCNDYIKKPIDIDLLPEQVEKYING